MKQKNIFLITITLLLGIVIVYESNSLIKTLNKKPNLLEDIKVMDLKKDQSIAIMVQDTEGDVWHEQEDRSKWPSPTTHGFVGAKCTDSEGAKIDYTTILQFNLSDYTAEINTKNSIYCTLYFAKGEPALNKLQNTGGDVFAGGGNHTTVVDGMYRYKGAAVDVTNNYICFGTTEKEECLAIPETYMYRIIGITSAKDDTLGIPVNSLKIIKATPSSKSQQWHNNNKDVKWDSSAMKSYLNGTTENGNSSGFLQTIINGLNGAYWESIILEYSWYNADYKIVPATEPTSSHTDASKIGLMYATDYKNSGDLTTDNWLFIKNGWSTNSTLSGDIRYEWTMSRYGDNFGTYSAHTMYPQVADLTWGYPVRPVFYLQSEVNLTGQGIASDPFRITTKNNA